MTAKDKAKELFDKMKGFKVKHSHSKKCAKVAVNELLENIDFIDTYHGNLSNAIKYWNDVLTEIDKL